MPPLKANILIAEDDPSVRTSLEQVFSVLGYAVRTVADGLQAVAALREAVPDILLSDLHMPGMSGYELLSVVNRRFPQVTAIAMSGAIPADAVLSGLSADAFYEKGRGIPNLLKTMEKAQTAERAPERPSNMIWMQKIDYEGYSADSVMIPCRECFRSFPKAISATASMIIDTRCIYCGGAIVFAVVPTLDAIFALPHRATSRMRPN